MNRTDQIIEIAKFCGWTMIENSSTIILGGAWVGYPPKMQIIGHKESLPNYLDDLNAMHEAEKSFDDNIQDAGSLRYRYSSHLYNTVVPKNEQPCRASAKHRAEAFLKTINKWKDDERTQY